MSFIIMKSWKHICLTIRNSNSEFLNSQQVWDMPHKTEFLHLGLSVIIHILKALTERLKINVISLIQHF